MNWGSGRLLGTPVKVGWTPLLPGHTWREGWQVEEGAGPGILCLSERLGRGSGGQAGGGQVPQGLPFKPAQPPRQLTR